MYSTKENYIFIHKDWKLEFQLGRKRTPTREPGHSKRPKETDSWEYDGQEKFDNSLPGVRLHSSITTGKHSAVLGFAISHSFWYNSLPPPGVGMEGPPRQPPPPSYVAGQPSINSQGCPTTVKNQWVLQFTTHLFL